MTAKHKTDLSDNGFYNWQWDSLIIRANNQPEKISPKNFEHHANIWHFTEKQ